MGNAAVGSPVSELSSIAAKLVHDEYEGKASSDSTGDATASPDGTSSSPSSSSSSSSSASAALGTSTSSSTTSAASTAGVGSGTAAVGDDEGGGENTLLKVHEVEALVKRLQRVRVDVEQQSKAMSESKVIEKMTSDEMEMERREIGTYHVSRDRTKSMEEYTDGTTIRRIDGSVERKKADGSIEQISSTNEVTIKTKDGDIAVLADHDTLLNQKLADGTQIQV